MKLLISLGCAAPFDHSVKLLQSQEKNDTVEPPLCRGAVMTTKYRQNTHKI